MKMAAEEQFALDILDLLPVISGTQQQIILQQALSQLERILPEKLVSNEMVNDFAVIHNSESFIFRKCWGEDTRLEPAPPLREKLYYRDKYYCLANPETVPKLLNNALCALIPKFGISGALVFIQDVWKEKLLVVLEQAIWFFWMLLRAELFQLSYQEACSEFEIVHSGKTPESGEGLDFEADAAALGKFNGERSSYPVEVYLENQSEHLEADMRLSSQSHSLSAWITDLRALLPRAVVYGLMAMEVGSCHNPDLKTVTKLRHNFTKRASELKTLIRDPLSRAFYFDIIGAVNAKLQKRALDYHYQELLHIPRVMYDKVQKLIDTQDLSFSALETFVLGTMLNPGHEWGYGQIKR